MVKYVAGFLIAVLCSCDDGESGGAPALPQPLATTVSGYRYYTHAGAYTLEPVDVEAAIELRVEEWIAGHPDRAPDSLKALARSYPIVVFPGTTIPSGGAGYCWWDQWNQQIHVAWFHENYAHNLSTLPLLVHELDHALLGDFH